MVNARKSLVYIVVKAVKEKTTGEHFGGIHLDTVLTTEFISYTAHEQSFMTLMFYKPR
jgi:hypothetical protein